GRAGAEQFPKLRFRRVRGRVGLRMVAFHRMPSLRPRQYRTEFRLRASAQKASARNPLRFAFVLAVPLLAAACATHPPPAPVGAADFETTIARLEKLDPQSPEA